MVYRAYHTALTAARESLAGPGLLLDLHGYRDKPGLTYNSRYS